MAETSKLRLVRCPKCENLLPELPDYSVYQCGGCGAVLRAKKGNRDGENGSHRSDEENIGVVCDKSDQLLSKVENFVGKGEVSGVENGEVRVSDSEVISNETVVADRFGNDSKRDVGKLVLEDKDSSKTELDNNANMESRVDKLETHVENANGLRRSSRVFERKPSDVGKEERLGRIRRGYFDGAGFSSSSQVGEGTSNYNLDSSYQNEAKRATRDPEREELLRKLDELEDQLSRVQNGNEKYHEKIPIQHRMARHGPCVEPEDYFRDHPSSFNRVSRQFSTPGKDVAGVPYLEPYYEPYPVVNRSDMSILGYNNSFPRSNYVPRYEDSFESQLPRRPPPRRIPTHHHYMGPEPDPFDTHPYDMNLHHLSCTCYQCFDRQAQVPLQVPPSNFGNRRFPHVANKAMPYRHELHNGFGSHGYNSRMVGTPPVGACDPQPRTRWPSDLNLETGSFSRSRPQKVVPSSGHRCQPIAGGAPFVTCQNCFELLKLPKKVFDKKGEWKMTCGACSSVISFAIEDEKLVSVDTSVKQTTTEEALDRSNLVGYGHMRRDNASYCSEDYANSVYDFQAMDREAVSSSTCQRVSSSKSEEMHSLHSVSATTSEDEHFSDDLATRQGVTSSSEPPEKAASSPPLARSPPQDPFDYTSKYRAVNRCGKGNLSSRSDQERIVTNKSTMRQNSLKESLATEMEIFHNDYPNNGVSQDSTDVCRDNQPKGKKGVDSFLAGIIKKSFKDFSRSNQTMESGKRNITINGHHIPDKLVKKAEKLAGPIHPGQYWYDYRAGFWGVMGGPCLGIIPPHIEEFNFPLQEDCAGGNTGVLVNGRELNQKDLDLLVTRGLPSARDRSYIVEISGRVVDEDSGEELENLGKLAPTVEKVKHGFGMRVPKAAA